MENANANKNKGSKMSQKCKSCEKCFRKPSELKYHIGRKHPSSNINVSLARPSPKDYNLLCEYCAKTFSNERNFKAHLKTHNFISKASDIHCPICDFTDSTKENLLSHFRTAHDILIEVERLNFNNIQEFSEWKTKIEKENNLRFVINRGVKRSKGFSKTVYYCHRSGHYKNCGSHLRHLKTQGSSKINGLCPASLKVHEYIDNNKCAVEYTKTHVGHDIDIGHIHLTEEERKKIAVKIAAKIPFKDILDEIRDSVTNCKIARMHLLTRKDLYNIESSFNLRSSAIRHKNDAISIDAWANEMQNKNCLLLYKAQNVLCEEYSTLKKEDFLLAIMTEGQQEMLKKYGNDCICVDGTHGINPYSFELHTVLVLDDMREGFPCAFLISNRSDEEVLTIFFSLISRKLDTKLQPKVFMSDLAPVYYNAWQRTMKPANFRLFCTWHIDKAWRKNLNKISTPEKRVSVYKILRTLLQETDKNAFERMIPKFIEELLSDPETVEYGKYFVDYYAHRTECWAYCYRLNSGINTNMHVERMHRTLKYLYMGGKHVKRLDLGIHAIMQFVRDKLFDRLITINKGKLSRKLKDLRNRHANSEKLTFDMIFPEETGWQVVSASCQTYFVNKIKTECQCKLTCSYCQNVCLHQYTCTCIDASIKWNMCKHIHLICRYLQSKPIAIIESNRQVQDPDDGNNNLVPNIKPTDEEECRIIEAISNPQELNEDDAVPILDLENFISNLNAIIRSNVRTVGDFRAFKKLVASIEPTLQAIQESKQKKDSLFTKEEPKPGAIPKITPQRNSVLFSTKKKRTKTNDKLKNVKKDSDNKVAINLLQ